MKDVIDGGKVVVHTDGEGRASRIHLHDVHRPDPAPGKETRHGYAQRKVGALGRKLTGKDYDGGHWLGHQSGGPGERINLFPSSETSTAATSGCSRRGGRA